MALAIQLSRQGMGARLEAGSDGSLPNKPMKLTVASGARSLSAGRWAAPGGITPSAEARMPFKVIDKNSKTEDWRSIFAARTSPTPSEPWSWCPGSYTRERTDDGKCPHCGQVMGNTWRGNRELLSHLVSPIKAGVYLIDVGETDRAPGPRCLKVGSSNNVPKRLQQHANDPKHQRCVVLHCLRCPSGWQVAYAMEYLINDQLARRGAAGRSSGQTWDYFEWDEGHIDFCRKFMVPEVVEEVLRVVERFAGGAGR